VGWSQYSDTSSRSGIEIPGYSHIDKTLLSGPILHNGGVGIFGSTGRGMSRVLYQRVVAVRVERFVRTIPVQEKWSCQEVSCGCSQVRERS
jgi:hypothetical protein